MHCLYCGVAVTPGAEHCAHCGTAIEWKQGEVEFHPPGDMVEVFRVWDPAMLPVIESLLATNDIPYIVDNDFLQDFLGWGRLFVGYNAITGPPSVKVPESRVEEARELLAERHERWLPDNWSQEV